MRFFVCLKCYYLKVLCHQFCWRQQNWPERSFRILKK
nr:MAG TPA: hypothetical protein [Caudoviricetes sp.]